MEPGTSRRYHRCMSRPLLLIVAVAAMLLAAGPSVAAVQALPSFLLQVPDSVGDVFVAETAAAALHRYSRDGQSGALRYRDSRYMSIGENGVGKQRSGDRRTPLGIYFPTGQLDTAPLPPKYGVTAFPLDYPNARDRQLGRSGGGIWIHGVDPDGGRRPVRDTDGCIALPNEELLAIEHALSPQVTPVIVTRRLATTEDSPAGVREALLERVEAWRRWRETGAPHTGLDIYAAEFRYRGLARDDWLLTFQEERRGAGSRRVSIEDLLLVRDPEDAGLFLARFRVVIDDDRGRSVLVKRLYFQLRPGEAGAGELPALRVVAEDAG